MSIPQLVALIGNGLMASVFIYLVTKKAKDV